MDAHPGVKLKGVCEAGNIIFPAIDIEDGSYGFFPYRMKLGDSVLLSALATPLCRLKTEKGEVFVFFGENEPHFKWENGKPAEILYLTRKDALNSWKVSLDQDYLILADNYVWAEDGIIKVTGGRDTRIKCFPIPAKGIPGFIECGREGQFSVYERKLESESVQTAILAVSEDEGKAEYEISLSYPEKQGKPGKKDRQEGRDTLLWFTYAGNKMELYLDGRKINDYFYTGQDVPVSLGYFDFPEKLRAVVYTLYDTDDIFLETKPAFEKGRACRLERIRVEEEFR